MGTVLMSIKKIKPKNIGGWLTDQMSRPDWFRRLFLQRTAWGAFSIYSHVKRSDGKPKVSYKSKAKAEKSAFDMAKKYGCTFTTYKCLFCDGWHVSKTERKNAEGKTTEEVALEKYSGKANVRPDGLDVERIMATKIPDFKYPVAYEEEWIVKMIELFPEFCRLIDNGRFYIACAMGLHRTDIALCTYWVFYAADKGIAPPAICGYRKDKGLTTNKIMRILNAVYRCMTEKNGVEPIPEIVFHERKEIIKELSRGK